MALTHAEVPAAIEAISLTTQADEYNTELSVETQTDKPAVKLVPCRQCKRPLVVTTFFSPAKAKCSSCKGEDPTNGVATVGQPEPGKTDPAKAVNLADCLINPHFAQALCPVRPDDDEHVMELINVSHSDRYGPGYFAGKNWKQLAQGETVMHQCRHCKATVAYSTTAQSQFKRQNEVRGDKHVNRWAETLGVREDS